MGKGFIKFRDIEPGIRFAMHHYTLKQDLHLKRKGPAENYDLVSIVFNSNEIPLEITPDRKTAIQFLKTNGSSIQIASSAFSTETIFPANIEVHFGAIGLSREVLCGMVGLEKVSGPLATILRGDELFFYHEKMHPEVQRTLRQISETDDRDELSSLYYKIKIRELIYLLFAKLLERGATNKGRLTRPTSISCLSFVRRSWPI
ncbi:hypothetical protein ACQ86N_10550 [Puia sp. P3]|uniref:hypothetical protein n=1 Tax=Puia sp. P3 TaxID=3423952 RepID=UPI003D67CDD9